MLSFGYILNFFLLDDYIVGMIPNLIMTYLCWNGFYGMMVAHMCLLVYFIIIILVERIIFGAKANHLLQGV